MMSLFTLGSAPKKSYPNPVHTGAQLGPGSDKSEYEKVPTKTTHKTQRFTLRNKSLHECG